MQILLISLINKTKQSHLVVAMQKAIKTRCSFKITNPQYYNSAFVLALNTAAVIVAVKIKHGHNYHGLQYCKTFVIKITVFFFVLTPQERLPVSIFCFKVFVIKLRIKTEDAR